ncbi:MAG TPA: hypothetical protein VD998_04325 [Verrucomicrobiae bacterium]|nr:hypothetical protein [Verrucomicrobiae bacterium]
MLIVYVAHPIGGNVTVNMASVKAIVDRMFNDRPEVYPIAPYLFALERLDDSKAEDRRRGIAINKLYFDRRFIDEVWLFGNRVSSGMWEEVRWARRLRIPVVPMNNKVLLSLIRKELTPGDRMTLIGSSHQQKTLATYLGEMKDGNGIYARNHIHPLLDLSWGDIAHIDPLHGTLPHCFRDAA